MSVNSFINAFTRLPFFRQARRRSLAETPRYPPFMQGLPAATITELIATQDVLIRRLRETSKLDDAEFTDNVMPCIRNYAAYVHLLPASQDHHHRGAGGLLRHGLEVAQGAAGAAYSTSFVGAEVVPKLRKPLELRWRVACLIAGMCHDLGKPISDLDVVDKEGRLVWDPFDPTTPYLSDFLRENRIDNYFLRWRRGRYRQHEDTAAIIFPRIVPIKTLQWLGEHNQDTRFHLVQSVSRGTSAPNSNRFREIVKEADRSSLLRDMKESFSSTPTGTVGFATQRHIIDAMRHLCSTGVWKINAVGGRVFVTNQGTFIPWPGNGGGGADIVRYIKENQIPGVTQDPDAIANDLIDIDVIEPQVVDGNNLRYWRVSLSVPTETGDIANISLFCVKLKDQSYVIDTYVPPISVVIHEMGGDANTSDGPNNEDALQDESHATGQASVATTDNPEANNLVALSESPKPSKRKSPTEKGVPATGDTVAVPASFQDQQESRDNTNPPTSGNAHATLVAASVAVQTSQQTTAPITGVGGQANAISHPTKKMGAEGNNIHALLHRLFPSSASAPSENDRSFFSSRGPAAASLLVIANTMREQTNVPRWFKITRDSIQLAYPEAFQAAGVEPTPKVVDLAATGLFMPNPMRQGSILTKDDALNISFIRLTREAGRNMASVMLYGGIDIPVRIAQRARNSPLTSSFTSTEDARVDPVQVHQAAPATRPRVAETNARRSDAVRQGNHEDWNKSAKKQPKTFGPQNAQHNSSNASIEYLALLREIFSAGGFSDEEAYRKGERVYLHPDAVRRFADAQGMPEDRIRTILCLSDCVNTDFSETITNGIRFPLA